MVGFEASKPKIRSQLYVFIEPFGASRNIHGDPSEVGNAAAAAAFTSNTNKWLPTTACSSFKGGELCTLNYVLTALPALMMQTCKSTPLRLDTQQTEVLLLL